MNILARKFSLSIKTVAGDTTHMCMLFKFLQQSPYGATGYRHRADNSGARSNLVVAYRLVKTVIWRFFNQKKL